MHPWKVFALSFALVSAVATVRMPAHRAPSLEVGFAPAAPEIDGELDEAIWQRAGGRTGAFTDRPYSEARFAWTHTHLFIALYAADKDIRSSDRFEVTLGRTTFDVSASGELRGAPAGTRAGVDRDGTIDDPSDDDEEWVIEVAVPLEAIDGSLDVAIRRSDAPQGVANAHLVLVDRP